MNLTMTYLRRLAARNYRPFWGRVGPGRWVLVDSELGCAPSLTARRKRGRYYLRFDGETVGSATSLSAALRWLNRADASGLGLEGSVPPGCRLP